MAFRPALQDRRLPALLAAVGLLFSVLLEALHVQTYLWPSDSSFCSLGESLDCVSVASSPTSIFLGLPWAIWGVVGFAALLVAALRRSIWTLPLSLVSAVVSIALLVVELRVVGSICLLCEVVHVVAVALASISVVQRKSFVVDWKQIRTLWLVFALPLSLLGSAFLFVPSYWGAFSWKSEPPFATGRTAEGYHWIGAAQPTLTINEFTDYECGHCSVGSARSLGWLLDHPGLRIVRRQHPRVRCSAGKTSCLAVRLAYCAEEQNRFWRADRWLFAHGPARQTVNPEDMARDLELDEPKLLACIARPDVVERAQADETAARKLRLVDTPAYLVAAERVRASKIKDLVKERAR